MLITHKRRFKKEANEALVAWARAHRWSQMALGEALGRSTVNIHRVFHGQIHISESFYQDLLNANNTPASQLYHTLDGLLETLNSMWED